jgi:hypothetical protein
MFLPNSSFNRHGSPCTLVSKSVHSDRVFILGAEARNLALFAYHLEV